TLAVQAPHLAVQSVARHIEKVVLSIVKGHKLCNVAKLFRQLDHQPQKERGVGHLVDDARARRQITGFYPECRPSIDDAVARPIPPPDGAIVQPPCGELWDAT